MKRKDKSINVLKVIFTAVLIVGIIMIVSKLSSKDMKVAETNETVDVSTGTKDEEAPIIELNGDSKVIIAVGSKFNDAGVTATDDRDGDITSNVEVSGTVDSETEGTYNLRYTVKDKAGNMAEAIRTVQVTKPLSNGLPVLMYHFFYDESKESGKDNNFVEIKDFEEQMKYLSENDFYFPSWEEVENYIDGKIILPEKSVVITVDDGDDSFFELAVPVIQKYNTKATSFVITSWYGYRAGNKQKNIDYQSHSDEMHEGGGNGKGVMLSWSYDKILKDVQQSSNTLGGSTVFCYPFGQYNDLDKKVLKDAGYKLAFTTAGGRVYKGSSKLELPRVRISKTTSLSEFKSMVK